MKTLRFVTATVLPLFVVAGCNRPNVEDEVLSARDDWETLDNFAEVTTVGMPATGDAKRGEYLVKIIGCNDCHTPWIMSANGPEPDMSRMLSGHPASLLLSEPPALVEGWEGAMSGSMTAWSGPWGISYTANLTPDPSGLEAWDEEIFIGAIRTGKHWGTSRDILPPMPWFAYRNMTDDDLKAIFAYLRTIPPIRNHVPDPTPPMPVRVAEEEPTKPIRG